MNEFTTAILLVTLLGAVTQDSTLEDKAVIRVQQTPASRYDPTLPSRPFGNWLNQVVGSQSGVSWRLGECIEQAETALEGAQGIPACVEATAILPDDRTVVAQIHVGTFKQGLAATSKFYFAVIESDSQFQSVRRLSDLPQLLREPFSAIKPEEGKILNVVALPQIKLNGLPQLSNARTPALFNLPEMKLNEAENDLPPPPPKPVPAPRISMGVSGGEVLVKAQPIYPQIARQINASGEVQVEITVDEKGRVVEAKAIKGHPVLRSAAVAAAKKWVFRPTMLDGKPVKQKGTLTFVFNSPR
jgi:TonB family protein